MNNAFRFPEFDGMGDRAHDSGVRRPYFLAQWRLHMEETLAHQRFRDPRHPRNAAELKTLPNLGRSGLVSVSLFLDRQALTQLQLRGSRWTRMVCPCRSSDFRSIVACAVMCRRPHVPAVYIRVAVPHGCCRHTAFILARSFSRLCVGVLGAAV